MKIIRTAFQFLGIALAFIVTGCSLLPVQMAETEVPADVQSTGRSEFEALSGSGIRQWAEGAAASSEYSDDDWSAEQATGAPDTDRCGDYQTAWASAASDSINTLVLTYTQSVYPQAINVYQSFNPDQVTQIRVIGEDDQDAIVYQGEPRQLDQPCPYILIVPVSGVEFQVNRVELTVDQSRLGMGWNEIDAVELVGEIDR